MVELILWIILSSLGLALAISATLFFNGKRVQQEGGIYRRYAAIIEGCQFGMSVKFGLWLMAGVVRLVQTIDGDMPIDASTIIGGTAAQVFLLFALLLGLTISVAMTATMRYTWSWVERAADA